MAVARDDRQEPPLAQARPVLDQAAPAGRGRRRSWHLGALTAALLYGAAAFAAFLLVRPALEDDAAPSRDAAAAESSVEAVQPPLDDAGRDVLATRALAARAQRSVFVIESPGGGLGSGFVGWVERGRSYVLTARAVVAGVLLEDGRTAFVRRGGQVWIGRIVAADPRNGLALIRVDTELARPLWRSAETTGLELGARAVVVPAGPDAGLGEGVAESGDSEGHQVRAPVHRLNLGAPVVDADGRLAGIVVGTHAHGLNSTVAIGRVCELIRRCG